MRTVLNTEIPWIDCYTTYAHMLSVLQGDERTYGWIFSNYIQIYMNKDIRNNSWGEFYRPFPYELMPFDTCKWLSVQKIRRSSIVLSSETLIDFIKNEIEQGYYVYLNIEHKFISSFETNGHYHDAIVYGIDDINDEVYVQDMFKRGRYEKKILTIAEFVDSVMNCKIPEEQDFLNGLIYSYKLKSNCDYEYNEKNIWVPLIEYLDGVIPEYWRFYNNSNVDFISFGINVLDTLVEYIETVNISNEMVDIRPFYFLRDHYVIMRKCIEWIKKKNKNKELDEAMRIYESLVGDANDLNFSLVFANNTKKLKKEKVVNLIKQMKERELNIKDIAKKCIVYN